MNEQELAALVWQLRERVSVMEDRMKPLLDRLPEAEALVAAWMAVDETTVHLCALTKGWKLPPAKPEVFEQGEGGDTALSS